MNEVLSTAATVHVAIGKLVQEMMSRHSDSKHNQGRQILEAYLWDEIEKLAKGKSNDAWEKMEKSGVYNKPDNKAGKYACGESPRFVIKATVTEPVKRFNEEELARVLEASSFKVPPHMTKGFVAAAKVPGSNQVRLSIVER